MNVPLLCECAGSEVSPVFAKTGLHTGTLAKIWQLADLDKDGRLSCEEFVVAMHLAEKVKSGLPLPRVLPAELYPGSTKYATVDRRATSSKTTPTVSILFLTLYFTMQKHSYVYTY